MSTPHANGQAGTPRIVRLSAADAAEIILEVSETRVPPSRVVKESLPFEFVDVLTLVEQDGPSGLERGLERYPAARDIFDEAVARRAAGGERAIAGRVNSKEYALTDLGNAERLVDLYGDDMRYCPELGGMFVWDGTRWSRDRTGQSLRFSKASIRSIGAEASRTQSDAKTKEKLKWAIESESRKHIDAALYLAQSDARIAVTPDQFNRDQWLFNCANGTVDLRTGLLRTHDRKDLLTKLAPVTFNPNASCVRWRKFLLEIFADDAELASYLARVAGYSITGDISVQEFYILFGDGANGKNIFIDMLLFMLGDYARQAEPSLLLAKKHEDHPTGIAALDGARFVSASETDAGRKLNEAMVKRLTGDEKISARFMHRDFYEFLRTFKVFLATNYRPIIKGKDRGIWRRVRLIPFRVTFVKPEEQAEPPLRLREDPTLKQVLQTEAAGILNWLVEGCLDWLAGGMRPPAAVMEATEAYRTDMDSVASFFQERCKIPGDKVRTSELYAVYRTHCEQSGVKSDDILTQTAFGKDLTKRGFVMKHEKKGNFRIGIELRSDQAELFGESEEVKG